ncbi:hypothetical protein [Exiguobacterium sp. s192]|uniref:hypothetical protein n=1 Tax=Exiguobacterium sp. s192 TaxID=2751206 RepID=UPI001BE972AC|nr:hypothetical protein [Exiguobacterium sp. s192]
MSDFFYYASLLITAISVIIFLLNPTAYDKILRKVLISIAVLLMIGVVINLFVEKDVSMSLLAKTISLIFMSILVVVYNGIEKSLTKSITWGILFMAIVIINGML